MTSSNSTTIYITVYKVHNTVCSYVRWAALDTPDAHGHVTQLFLTCFHSFEGRASGTVTKTEPTELLFCPVCQRSAIKKSEIKPQNCWLIQTPGASNTLWMSCKFVLDKMAVLKRNTTIAVTIHFMTQTQCSIYKQNINK